MHPVIGHRGFSSRALENTQFSVELAAKQGLRWIELDVVCLHDGSMVIFHDADLMRLFADHRCLNQLSYSDFFQFSSCGCRLLSLQSVLQLCQDLGLSVNLELKVHSMDVRRYCDCFLRQFFVSQFHGDVVISSFSTSVLHRIADATPGLKKALLVEDIAQVNPVRLSQLGVSNIHLKQKLYNPEEIKKIQYLIKSNYLFYAYTVNDWAIYHYLLHLGFSGVFSDCPDRLLGQSFCGY